MTNIPTLGELLLFVAVMAFIPFWISFMISYLSYRQLKAGLVGAIIGTIIFFLTMGFLTYSLWIRGIILGLIGGIVGAIILSRFYKSQGIEGIMKVFNRRNTTLIVIIVLLFSLLSIYYSFARKNLEFEISDPSGDVSESGYTEPKLSGHDNIDILRLTSHVAGDSVVLEMEIAGEVSENERVGYTFFIATEKLGFWTQNIDYRYPNNYGKMEKDGRILRARIPIESLKNRKVFQVTAIAIDNKNGLYDNVSNIGLIEQMLGILTVP